MELKPLKDEINLFTMRQKESTLKTQQIIDQLIQELQQSISNLQTDDQEDSKAILHNLKHRFNVFNPISQIELEQKPLNTSLDKYTELLEKTFNPNISKAYRHIEMDSHTVNEIIITHLYRSNQFDLGDLFANESGETKDYSAIRNQFFEIYTIVKSIENDEFEPAFTWYAENKYLLIDNGSKDFDLKLHRQQFISILQKNPNGRNQALQYARDFLIKYSSTHKIEIKKLMGCLLWAGRLEKSPYSDLLSSIKSENISNELMKAHWLSDICPLITTIAAGMQSLPVLLKLIDTAMKGKEEQWQTMEELPFPVDLDRKLYFHSIFICPITGERERENNPALRLVCGHVMLYETVKMLYTNAGGFPVKCPFCPVRSPDRWCIWRIYF